MKKIKYAAFGLLGVGLIVLFCYGLTIYLTTTKYDRGYAQIKVGDSKDVVVNVMGKPDEIQRCMLVSSANDTPEDKKYREKCFEQYWYYSFLKSRVISFDKEGRVLVKGYQVSP